MENEKSKVGLVIMASGLGKRFGGNKLMAELCGKPLIQWGIDATEGIFDRRVVVTRHEEVKKLCEDQQIEVIMHDFPGRNDTVRLGLEKMKDETDICFFLAGDQPLITKQTLFGLAEAARENPEKIIRSCYKDMVGNPVGFPKATYEKLLTLPEGKGGNYVVKDNPELVRLFAVNQEHELWDVDSPEDLKRAEQVLELTAPHWIRDCKCPQD